MGFAGEKKTNPYCLGVKLMGFAGEKKKQTHIVWGLS